MKSNVVLALLLGVGTVGFLAWRVWTVSTMEAPQYEVVEDPSGSHGPACASLEGLVGRILDSPGATSGSVLTVLDLGDESTANEPRRIGTHPFLTNRRVAQSDREIARERASIVDEINAQCRAIGQTNISPIFLGVEQAVADLHARGCVARSHCTLIVDSDLQENVEASIKVRFAGPTKHARALPPPIDNAGIEVVFCGYVVAVGRSDSPSGRTVGPVPPRNAAQEERLQQIWRELFTMPEGVSFEPYCMDSIAQ